MRKKPERGRVVGDEIVKYRCYINELAAHHVALASIVFFGLFSALPTPSPATASDATGLVVQAARKHGVPIGFALRVARVESGIKCGRVGKAGERGPLQILPRSAKGLGYRNIARAGCAAQTSAGMKHLAACYRKAGGNLYRAAACHNGGPGVLRWKRIPRSIQAYARKVTR